MTSDQRQDAEKVAEDIEMSHTFMILTCSPAMWQTESEHRDFAQAADTNVYNIQSSALNVIH